MTKERIAKFIAHAGVCSRREAETLIEAGRVKVNGEVIDTPALKVGGNDVVAIDDKEIKKSDVTKLWLFYKPKGTITTNKDTKGRKTVFEVLPERLPRVISVGRLDYNTEGLLLLTNNGEFARHLELPSSGLQRKYRARVYGDLSERVIRLLAQGVTIDGFKYGKIIVSLEGEKTTRNFWINISLHEGKNREIRKVLKHFDIEVSKLIRVEFGPFNLGDLKVGEAKEMPYNRLKGFMKEVGFLEYCK
jgi:23S rRNA pseudouridine2605 synthase